MAEDEQLSQLKAQVAQYDLYLGESRNLPENIRNADRETQRQFIDRIQASKAELLSLQSQYEKGNIQGTTDELIGKANEAGRTAEFQGTNARSQSRSESRFSTLLDKYNSGNANQQDIQNLSRSGFLSQEQKANLRVSLQSQQPTFQQNKLPSGGNFSYDPYLRDTFGNPIGTRTPSKERTGNANISFNAGNNQSLLEPNFTGYRTGRLTTGNSMSPYIPVGTPLALSPYKNQSLSVGEIIRFKYAPYKNEAPYTAHRIFGFADNGKVITRGDNNPSNKYEIFPKSDITDIVVGSLDNGNVKRIARPPIKDFFVPLSQADFKTRKIDTSNLERTFNIPSNKRGSQTNVFNMSFNTNVTKTSNKTSSPLTGQVVNNQLFNSNTKTNRIINNEPVSAIRELPSNFNIFSTKERVKQFFQSPSSFFRNEGLTTRSGSGIQVSEKGGKYFGLVSGTAISSLPFILGGTGAVALGTGLELFGGTTAPYLTENIFTENRNVKIARGKIQSSILNQQDIFATERKGAFKKLETQYQGGAIGTKEFENAGFKLTPNEKGFDVSDKKQFDIFQAQQKARGTLTKQESRALGIVEPYKNTGGLVSPLTLIGLGVATGVSGAGTLTKFAGTKFFKSIPTEFLVEGKEGTFIGDVKLPSLSNIEARDAGKISKIVSFGIEKNGNKDIFNLDLLDLKGKPNSARVEVASGSAQSQTIKELLITQSQDNRLFLEREIIGQGVGKGLGDITSGADITLNVKESLFRTPQKGFFGVSQQSVRIGGAKAITRDLFVETPSPFQVIKTTRVIEDKLIGERYPFLFSSGEVKIGIGESTLKEAGKKPKIEQSLFVFRPLEQPQQSANIIGELSKKVKPSSNLSDRFNILKGYAQSIDISAKVSKGKLPKIRLFEGGVVIKEGRLPRFEISFGDFRGAETKGFSGGRLTKQEAIDLNKIRENKPLDFNYNKPLKLKTKEPDIFTSKGLRQTLDPFGKPKGRIGGFQTQIVEGEPVELGQVSFPRVSGLSEIPFESEIFTSKFIVKPNLINQNSNNFIFETLSEKVTNSRINKNKSEISNIFNSNKPLELSSNLRNNSLSKNLQGELVTEVPLTKLDTGEKLQSKELQKNFQSSNIDVPFSNRRDLRFDFGGFFPTAQLGFEDLSQGNLKTIKRGSSYAPDLAGILSGKRLKKEPKGSKIFFGLETRYPTQKELSISPFGKLKNSSFDTTGSLPFGVPKSKKKKKSILKRIGNNIINFGGI